MELIDSSTNLADPKVHWCRSNNKVRLSLQAGIRALLVSSYIL